jgi:hypothetical protein
MDKGSNLSIMVWWAIQRLKFWRDLSMRLTDTIIQEAYPLIQGLNMPGYPDYLTCITKIQEANSLKQGSKPYQVNQG